MTLENQVITYDVTDSAIECLKTKYANLTASNKKEYKELSSALSQVRKYRTSVEKRRKELKADALAYGRKVDTEAKRITEKLLEIENPLKHIKDEYDEKEKARKEEEARIERERIDGIIIHIKAFQDLPFKAIDSSSEEIKEAISYLEGVEITEEVFFEFLEEATNRCNESLERLNSMYESKLEAEANAKRIAELEEAEKARQEEEEPKVLIKAVEDPRTSELKPGDSPLPTLCTKVTPPNHDKYIDNSIVKLPQDNPVTKEDTLVESEGKEISFIREKAIEFIKNADSIEIDVTSDSASVTIVATIKEKGRF